MEALHDAGVDFVVIGGVALTLHGSTLITADTDVMYGYAADNVERLAGALAEMDVRLRDAPDDLPFKPDARTLRAGLNFTFTSKYGDLDVLGQVDGVPGYEELRKRAQLVKLGQRTVRVAGVGDLIAMKTAAGRTKDLRGLDDLEAIRALDQEWLVAARSG